MPKLLGTAFSSAVVASKPPAEAPIPTTGNLLLPWDLDRSVSRCSAGVVPFSFIGASAPDFYWNGSILRHVTPPCEGLHTTHLPPDLLGLGGGYCQQSTRSSHVLDYLQDGVREFAVGMAQRRRGEN